MLWLWVKATWLMSLLVMLRATRGNRGKIGAQGGNLVVMPPEDGRVLLDHRDVLVELSRTPDSFPELQAKQSALLARRSLLMDKVNRFNERVCRSLSEPTNTLLGHTGPVLALASPHASFDSRTFAGPGAGVGGIGSRSQILFSSSIDRDIRVWDLSQTPPVSLYTLPEHRQGPSELIVNHNNTLLISCSADQKVIVWDLTANVPTVLYTLTLESDTVYMASLAVTQEGMLFAGASNGSIVCWDLRTGTPTATPLPMTLWNAHTALVGAMLLTPDERFVVSSAHDGSICVGEIGNATPCKFYLSGHTEAVIALAQTQTAQETHRLFSGSNDHSIVMWDMSPLYQVTPQTPTQLHSLPSAHNNQIIALAITLDNTRLFSGSQDKTIGVWDISDLTAKPKLLHQLQGHAHYVRSLSLCNVGDANTQMLCSGSYDDTIKAWPLLC
eukprot:m.4663 g.4663  ORF g.4663 m.4663 type:complete len:442 (-) comp4541_c0_seq1:127-1452(-)